MGGAELKFESFNCEIPRHEAEIEIPPEFQQVSTRHFAFSPTNADESNGHFVFVNLSPVKVDSCDS